MRPLLPLISGLLGLDILAAGATWCASELAGRDGLDPAIAVLLVASPLGLLVAHYAPLPLSRRVGRRRGITHVGSTADRALTRLRQLVIEVEHVVTTGQLVVVDVAPIDLRHKNDLRWFAGALAHGSTDPVARAIAKLSGLGRPIDVTQGPSHELRGAVDRHPVRFGLNGVDGPPDQVVGTTVRVDVDLRPMGHITVADEVRKNAARCLSTLRAEGIEPILVSSSLRAPDLKRVSEEVGVSQIHHGTDARTIAATLPTDTTGILRAAAPPDASGGSGASSVVAEATLPSEPGEDAVVRCANPSIEAVLESIQHLRCLRRARLVARGCAAAAIVVAVPLAATGLIALAHAALLAAASLLLVAVVASTAVMLNAAPDPS